MSEKQTPATELWTASWLVLCLAFGLGMAAPLAAENVCTEFPKSRQIHVLGGDHAFAAAVETKEELAATFATCEKYPECAGDIDGDPCCEIAEVLDAETLGAVADDVVRKLRAGDVNEGEPLKQGQVLEWMVWRGDYKGVHADKMCVASKKSWPTFALQTEVEIPVTRTVDGVVQKGTKTTTHRFLIPKACVNLAYVGAKDETDWIPPEDDPPACKLDVTRDCAGNFAIDTAGSYGTVAVTMGGSRVELDANGKGTAKDPDGNQSVVFTLTATNKDGKSCTTKKEPPRCPSCELTATPDEVMARQSVDVGATGYWSSLTLTADGGGTSVEVAKTNEPSPFESAIPMGSPGEYLIVGKASNEIGQTAECSAQVTVLPRWTVRLFGLSLDPATDSYNTASIRPDGQAFSDGLNLSSGSGFGASLEYLIAPRWGLELSAMFADLDSMYIVDIGEAWGMESADLDVQPITLGINYHLTSGKRADVYLGAFLAAVSYDDLVYNTLGETFRFDLDNETGFGAQLGVDVPFGASSPWAFHAAARYLELSAEDDSTDLDLDVDPLILGAGLAYSF